MVRRLSKAKSGVQRNAFGRDARSQQHLRLRLQEGPDFGHQVRVAGGFLHRFGVPLHMHQAQPGMALRDSLDRPRLAEAPDIVDQVGAGIERGAHHVRLVGVDRQRPAAFAQRLDDRHHPIQLLLPPERRGPGPARLAADVDEVGPFGNQLLGVAQRGIAGGMPATVGKRIGRDVEDAHDQWATVTRVAEASALEMRRGGNGNRQGT